MNLCDWSSDVCSSDLVRDTSKKIKAVKRSKGFEDLAREYVKDVFSFPYGEWKETSTTHDGNKDAYTIIIGFHPNLLENEVWWMEAKYSTERMYLSRFKLDATIVSSIFNRSVSKIIFVTNIEIKAKVISDVRTALYNGTSCKREIGRAHV